MCMKTPVEEAALIKWFLWFLADTPSAKSCLLDQETPCPTQIWADFGLDCTTLHRSCAVALGHCSYSA